MKSSIGLEQIGYLQAALDSSGRIGGDQPYVTDYWRRVIQGLLDELRAQLQVTAPQSPPSSELPVSAEGGEGQ